MFLKKHKIKFTREKTFTTCVNTTGALLRFDFYIPSKNLLIEYQGEHHFIGVKRNKNWSDQHTHNLFELVLKKDDIKRKWCTDNGIFLLEITFKQYKRINSILKNKLISKT